MALGLGEGGEQNAPLGRAVIGGLMFATVTTLFVVPIIYTYLRKRPPVDYRAAIGGTGAGGLALEMPHHRARSANPSAETVEERLRRENRELKRQLEQLTGSAHAGASA